MTFKKLKGNTHAIIDKNGSAIGMMFISDNPKVNFYGGYDLTIEELILITDKLISLKSKLLING